MRKTQQGAAFLIQRLFKSDQLRHAALSRVDR
jgi:hypothetical protein